MDFVMGADTKLSVAYYGPTSFIAKGTSAAPITFVGETPSPGFWAGITVEAQAKTSSAFDYVQISHAGGDGKAALDLNAKLLLTNSKISQSAGPCISKTTGDSTDYLLTNSLECTPPFAPES